MSYVSISPELVASSRDAAWIGSAINAANAQAAASTTQVPATGADEVSAGGIVRGARRGLSSGQR
jgi:hypothetical protein